MTRTIAYHTPYAPSFGGQFDATMTDRRMEIGFGTKRFHFTIRSSRFHQSARRPEPRRTGSVLWRAMGYVGCASLALGLAFASGSMLRASPPVDPYAVVVPIDAKAAHVAPRPKARLRQAVRPKPVMPFLPVTSTVEDWAVSPATGTNDVDPAIARPDSDVATLPTTNGERAVAVYGPTRQVDGKSCRDVSVFVRDTDGKVSVSPSTECKAAR